MGLPTANAEFGGGVSVLDHTSETETPRAVSTDHAATVEQKYAFSMAVEHKLRHWLDVFLKPDAEYDAGIVSSIYFDSPTFALYAEKRHSDYLKTKVRLRWYGSLDRCRPDELVPAFLELKRKVGAVRDKQRIPVRLPANVLTSAPFSHAAILDLPRLLDEQGWSVAHGLVPLLIVRYTRRRYVDSETAARIAFDTRIECPAANPRLMHNTAAVSLPVGVLEVKSRWRHLPPVLAGVGPDLRKEAFSKYALCCESLFQPLGRNL